MQPSNEDIMTVLHENTVSKDRKELQRETSKLSAIKKDTKTDEELLAQRMAHMKCDFVYSFG